MACFIINALEFVYQTILIIAN